MRFPMIGLLFVAHIPRVATGQSAQASASSKQAEIYARPFEPAIAPALLPLPPGAVEPEGWLRDWARSARDGITGHLDEWHPTFADGWKGIPIQAPGAKPDGTGWPLEQSAYWLDGAIRLGFVPLRDRPARGSIHRRRNRHFGATAVYGADPPWVFAWILTAQT